MKKIDPILVFDGWNIYKELHGFYCANNGKTIWFDAEYTYGTRFKIHSFSDGKRCYTSPRYFSKIIPLVREMTFELLKNDCLWDNAHDCNGLISYKKDMLPYYMKCKEKGLAIAAWFENLYK